METDYYIGTVTYTENDPDGFLKKSKEFGEIICDIPGVEQSVRAFPKKNELDEPKPGDLVLLHCLDPVYRSYFLYEKLRENDVIGFRSAGKMVDITPDSITIGVFDPGKKYKDTERPECETSVVLDKSGNITITSAGNTTVTVSGNAVIDCSGDVSISGSKVLAKGDDVTVSGSNVKVTGGNLTVSGSAAPTGSGPFCGIPNCLFTGAPHVGNKVSGT